ncbi:MAG: hypothetical protein ACRDKZ_06635 [Actinomycetota bacterium]
MDRQQQQVCGFMSGPLDPTIKVSSARWWLAISRDVMATEYRRMNLHHRPPVGCNRTPTFISPIGK